MRSQNEILLICLKIRIQTALAYRFNVISTILIQCLIMYAMSCFWAAAYSGAETVSGASQRDMITYTTISVIMGNLLTMGVQNRIARSVRTGSVALDLLKPVNIYGIYLAEDLGDCAAAFFQKPSPCFWLGTVLFGFPMPASSRSPPAVSVQLCHRLPHQLDSGGPAGAVRL